MYSWTMEAAMKKRKKLRLCSFFIQNHNVYFGEQKRTNPDIFMERFVLIYWTNLALA